LRLLKELVQVVLAKCEEVQQFESIALTRLFQEVIIASTGTVQAFVLSMALCIETKRSFLRLQRSGFPVPGWQSAGATS